MAKRLKLTFNIMMTKHPRACSLQKPQKGLIHLLLPMGGHHLDLYECLCTLIGWIQIWFDTPTENITGLQNKQGQSEQIKEIYRVPALHRNMWNIKDTLSDFVIGRTAALKPQDVLLVYCWYVRGASLYGRTVVKKFTTTNLGQRFTVRCLPLL